MACPHDNLNGFELESPNLHQICILKFSQLVLKMGVIDIDLQGHLAIISTKETTFDMLFYTDLGRPKGVTCPKRALVYVSLNK